MKKDICMNQAPTLQTDRLTLRATLKEDFEGSARLWADPDVVRYIGGQPSSRHDSWLRLLRLPGLWALVGYGYWTVIETQTGAFVGQAGLADFQRELSIDISGMPEAGWVFSPEFHGRGLAFEAMQAVLSWADNDLRAERTCALIAPENAPSIRLAKKLGYGSMREGRLGEVETLVFYRERVQPSA